LDHGEPVASDLVERAEEVLEKRAVQTRMVTDACCGMAPTIDPPFGHRTANALAVGVVAEPVDIQTGTQADVDQVVAMLGIFGVEPRAAEVREQAGHRDRGRGPAGGDVAEVHEILDARQRRVRRSGIAAQLEVRGACRLADDQDHQHRLAGLAGRDRVGSPGVLADPDIGLWRLELLADMAAEAGEEVHLHQHVPQFAMIAQQRRVVLVQRGGDATQQCEGHDRRDAAIAQFAEPAPLREPHPQDECSGQDAEQRHLQQHPSGEQLPALDGVGLEDIADHHLVDDGAVHVDEVAGGGGEHQHHCQQRSGDRPEQGERRQEQVDGEAREYGETEQESRISDPRRRPQPGEVRPERQVEDEQAPQRDDRGERREAEGTAEGPTRHGRASGRSPGRSTRMRA
jgi:hypothetical protein